uniref:Uncharacterized protein LOC111113241 n=1 Tax=Crassostrea virginica TaxID=6565 RepID=A0A8B8BUL9_CRAVI|nr:uncharacterized protein LOC111113241 [Crassostrea virginica]
MSDIDWKKGQKADKTIARVLEILEQRENVSEQAPKKQQFHTPVTSSSDDSSESSSDESDRGCTRVYIIPQRRHQHTSLSELHDSSCSSRALPSFARSRSSAVSFGSSEPGTSMPVRRTNRVRKPPD